MSNQENEILEAIEMFDYDNATEEEKKEFINLLRSVNLKKPVNNTTTNTNKPVVEGFTNRELGINGNKKQQQTEEVSTEFSGTSQDAPNSFVKNRQQNNVTVAEGDQPVQIQKYVNESGLNIKQGYLNPILRQEQKKIITIDSSNRKKGTVQREVIISKDASGNCITDICDNYILPENPGHFLINLEEPLDNVISLKLNSYEIPTTWYSISPQNGNDFFQMKFDPTVIQKSSNPASGNPCAYSSSVDPTASWTPWLPVVIPPGNYRAYTNNVNTNPDTLSIKTKAYYNIGITGAPLTYETVDIPFYPTTSNEATISIVLQNVLRKTFSREDIFVIYNTVDNKITITTDYDASGNKKYDSGSLYQPDQNYSPQGLNGAMSNFFSLLFFDENDQNFNNNCNESVNPYEINYESIEFLYSVGTLTPGQAVGSIPPIPPGTPSGYPSTQESWIYPGNGWWQKGLRDDTRDVPNGIGLDRAISEQPAVDRTSTTYYGGYRGRLRDQTTGVINMGRPATTKNNNLGYLLGFRKPFYTGKRSYTGEAPVDLNAIKYLYIVLDDFNTNFTNKVFLQSFDVDDDIIPTLPSYYNKDLYATEVSGNSVFVKDTNLQEDCPKFPVEQQRPDACVEKILDAPKLTQAQKYSVEQILTNRLNNKETPQVSLNQTSSNTICRITNNALDKLTSLSNETSILTETNVKNIPRNYFGPVRIKRFEVSLVNDKGNIIDMNLGDWSFSLEVTQLYQF
jgi:hypothetical protein